MSISRAKWLNKNKFKSLVCIKTCFPTYLFRAPHYDNNGIRNDNILNFAVGGERTHFSVNICSKGFQNSKHSYYQAYTKHPLSGDNSHIDVQGMTKGQNKRTGRRKRENKRGMRQTERARNSASCTSTTLSSAWGFSEPAKRKEIWLTQRSVDILFRVLLSGGFREQQRAWKGYSNKGPR